MADHQHQDRVAIEMSCNDAREAATAGEPDRVVLSLRIALTHAERWQYERSEQLMSKRSPTRGGARG